jgi:hypothetical protein
VKLTVLNASTFEAAVFAPANQRTTDAWRVVDGKLYGHPQAAGRSALPGPASTQPERTRMEIAGKFGYARWTKWVSEREPAGVAHDKGYTAFRYEPASARELATDWVAETAASNEVVVWVRDVDGTIRYARIIGRNAEGQPVYDVEQYFGCFGLPFSIDASAPAGAQAA